MTTISFQRFDMADDTDVLTVEDVYKHYTGIAGLEKLELSDDITNFDVTKWNSINPLSSVTYGSIISKSSSLEVYQYAWYSDDMPHSYVIEFTAHRPVWRYAFRGNPATGSYYELQYIHDTSDYIVLYRYDSYTAKLLDQREMTGTEAQNFNRVKIAVRDAPSTSDSNSRIIYVSLWLNDVFVFANSDVVTTNPALKMGLMISPGANGVLYSDLRIPNLGEIIIQSSLDPGEYPIGAISRAIEDRYIRAWMRWNGAFKVWKPKARPLSFTITPSQELSMTKVSDIKQVFSHIRMLGAFQWVQVKDNELLRLVGRRYRELQNTNVWNTQELYQAGLILMIRMKEQANQLQIVTYGLPFIEIEDRISVPDLRNEGEYVDYIVDSIDHTYEANSLRTQINCRKYYFGEP